MAASAWVIHYNFKKYLGDGVIDLDNDTFNMTLHDDSGGLVPISDPETDDFGDVTDELATENGYTQGGQAVETTWVESGGTVTFDCADGQWTASGGSIVARYAAIYDASADGDPVVCHSLLDTTPGDVTATDGNTFTVQINASGVFSLT